MELNTITICPVSANAALLPMLYDTFDFLKIKPTEFPDGLDMRYESKRGIKSDSKVFVLALEEWDWHLLQ